MKKSTLVILFISFIITLNNNLFSQKKQKPFTGIIIYSLTYEGYEPSQSAQMPSTSKVYISESKQKTYVDMGMQSISTIIDGEKESMIVILDLMGQKYIIKKNKEDIDKSKGTGTKPEIKYFDETKKIAGYTCKKAIITEKNEKTSEESTIVIWYSDEISSNEKINFATDYEGLKGYPLSTELTVGKLKNITIATEVKKSKVADTEFLLPSDGKVLTEEEIKKMFGGSDVDE